MITHSLGECLEEKNLFISTMILASISLRPLFRQTTSQIITFFSYISTLHNMFRHSGPGHMPLLTEQNWIARPKFYFHFRGIIKKNGKKAVRLTAWGGRRCRGGGAIHAPEGSNFFPKKIKHQESFVQILLSLSKVKVKFETCSSILFSKQVHVIRAWEPKHVMQS